MKIYLARLTALSRPSQSSQILIQSLLACLSPDETTRYHRFVRSERAQQFLVGRYLLRQRLGEMLDIAPVDVPLIERANNVPLLDLALPQKISFSISHSRLWVACAISTEVNIGLDIEVIDHQRDILALAEHSFEATQLAQFLTLEKPQGIDYFYRYWTAQEAQFKLHASCKSLMHLSYPLPPQAAELAICLASDQVISSDPPIIEVGI